MRYLSACSGIEAASAAWHDLGWTPVAFSEIEPFPSAVLAQRFPSVPNWGDMTRFKEWPDADVDVLVGGTPCQSFSVAGLRKGLDDPRGSLMLTFLGIAARYRPEYVVWENVPGVLSSNGGRDFGSFLGALGQLGYGWAYRVLDAQWFGVAQRRRRVFVVGCAGDQRRSAQVLFEREGVCRDPAPRREAGERPAPSLAARTRGGGGLGTDAELDGALIASTGTGRGTPLVPVAFHPTQDPISSTDGTTHANGGGQVAVAFDMRGREGGAQFEGPHDTANIRAASGGSSRSYVAATAVRRLTPRECERLQGFPDDWTMIPWRGKPAAECPDGPRYKALGNSMAVPCMRWLGQRIAAVDVDPFA